MDYEKASLEMHKSKRGKIGTLVKTPVKSRDDLSLAYTPGVAGPVREIARDKSLADIYTNRSNTVAIVSDGSAVLGLGDVGPEAALPVMEGKAVLFKEFADIDAFPLVLNTQDPDEIVETVKLLSPSVGGVNLEDISAPRCFEIEDRLQDIGIPVFHDDQHGTAIVVQAGLINALKIVGKSYEEIKVVVAGSGAAGIAISKLLTLAKGGVNVDDLIVCDSKGIISSERDDLHTIKKNLLSHTNNGDKSGTLKEALKEADVFIGVSAPDLLSSKDVETMASDPIIFALANPNPEITPEEAKRGGAAVVATGRSDYPNQVNNVLAYPSVFRAAFDHKLKRIDDNLKQLIAHALADYIKKPKDDKILPDVLDKEVVKYIAKEVSRVL